jgi:GNAT superfamily N-acetyltransferase
MSVVIRRAERQDAQLLLDLITALAHYEKLEPPDAGARQRLIEDGWGDRPRYAAWLAELHGRAVAYAIVFETYSTFLAQPTLYIEDIFVLPDYRRNGVGGALFRRLVQEAVDQGCGRMEWVCLDWNQPGLEFYEKLGARRLGEWVTFRLTRPEMQQLVTGGPKSETSSS